MEGVSAAVERLWPGRSAAVEELGGGITNRNYKVTVGDDVFVLRMGGAKTSLLGIDRAVEFAAGRRAFEVGVGPEVVQFVPEEGWLVARFIAGRPIPVEEMRDPATLGRVVGALRRFHSADGIPGRFDAWAVVDSYRALALEHGVKIPSEFDSAREVAERIRTRLGPRELVPCHNDLLNANFLDDGEVRIVDWEYAGMGDRFFDLANFSVNHEFSEDDDRALLEAYFGATRDEDLAAVRLMRFMSDFREAMWGVLQSGISDLDFDFRDYATRHFVRLEATAASIGPAYGLDQKN
ncbi:MAG TPA: choline/ethanolamine kinase family protein [Candidatus Dormibacteraeota bacterium]|nr:choline/ethanolamine kinase family protein [Candidatus Dormibacteraeota bacterium]